MSSNADPTGILLVAHGTRSQIGVEQFLLLARSIGERLAPLPVKPAFLELTQPDIDEAVDRLLSRGINRLVTMPLLLFAAGHIKRDIPAAIAAAIARRDKNIDQLQADHLGCHPAVVELSRRRMDEASLVGWRVQRPLVPPDEKTCLLLVARGSRDDSATAEMHDFARLRQQESVGWAPPTTVTAGTAHPAEMHVEVAFLAMARPLLNEKLAEVAAKRYSRVFVQPHFLFHGELVDHVCTQLAAMASNHPETDWLVTAPLADKPGVVTPATRLLEKVIFDRLRQVGIHVVALAAHD